MSAPVLTPLETPIWDDDIVEEMDARVPLVCAMPDCGGEAVVLLAIRCCGADAYYCEPCFAQVRRDRSILLSIARTRCNSCGHRWAKGLEFGDVYQEMPV